MWLCKTFPEMLLLVCEILNKNSPTTKKLPWLGLMGACSKLLFSNLFDRLFGHLTPCSYLLALKSLDSSPFVFNLYQHGFFCFRVPFFNLTSTSAMWPQKIKACPISAYYRFSKSLIPHVTCFLRQPSMHWRGKWPQCLAWEITEQEACSRLPSVYTGWTRLKRLNFIMQAPPIYVLPWVYQSPWFIQLSSMWLKCLVKTLGIVIFWNISSFSLSLSLYL